MSESSIESNLTSTSPPLTNSTSTSSSPVVIPPRPDQHLFEQVYTQSLTNLAQCDEQYCDDASLRYTTALLQFVLKAAPEEWETIMKHRLHQEELLLDDYLSKIITKLKIEKLLQQDLDEYRIKRWKNPLLGYDVRKYQSPLHYRGAPDFFRRYDHQPHPPTILQCLDFAPIYHRLKLQHQQLPDHYKLKRQYTYSLFDTKSCIPGVQCKGLRPYLLYCLTNPKASPEQVENCLLSIPNFQQCSKPGFKPDPSSYEADPELYTFNNPQNRYYDDNIKQPTNKLKIIYALRLRHWVKNAFEMLHNKPKNNMHIDPNMNHDDFQQELKQDVIDDEELFQEIVQNYSRFDIKDNTTSLQDEKQFQPLLQQSQQNKPISFKQRYQQIHKEKPHLRQSLRHEQRRRYDYDDDDDDDDYDDDDDDDDDDDGPLTYSPIDRNDLLNKPKQQQQQPRTTKTKTSTTNGVRKVDSAQDFLRDIINESDDV